MIKTNLLNKYMFAMILDVKDYKYLKNKNYGTYNHWFKPRKI